MSRRGLLCAGGAGFVGALIGTLAGISHTARAQALTSTPPEVDSLAVRISKASKWLLEKKVFGILRKFARGTHAVHAPKTPKI